MHKVTAPAGSVILKSAGYCLWQPAAGSFLTALASCYIPGLAYLLVQV